MDYLANKADSVFLYSVHYTTIMQLKLLII